MFSWLKPVVNLDLRISGTSCTDWDVLWRMYETARAESISAQQMMQQVIYWTMTAASLFIAAVTLLRGLNDLGLDSYIVQLTMWAVSLCIGLLGGTQYVSELGRMMRAGSFARSIERAWLESRCVDAKEDQLWETYLAQRDNRLRGAGVVSALATILALGIAQSVPFLVYSDHGPLAGPIWMLFPGAGVVVVLGAAVGQFVHYAGRYPSR